MDKDMENQFQNEVDRNRKSFSLVKTFLSNVKSVLTRERVPFKKFADEAKEVAHCKEYDVQGIFVK